MKNLMALIFVSIAVTAYAADPVPAAYTNLYLELLGNLNKLDKKLDSMLPIAQQKPLTFSGDLISANSHLGEQLLTSANWYGTILLLDRLKEIGLTAVKVDINFPVLTEGFPRSDEYLQFYKNLAAEIRARNMKIHVQSQLTFTNPEFSPGNCAGSEFEPIVVDYSKMTLAAMKMMKRAYAVKIINEIRPDYLTVANEPNTLATISGIAELRDPVKFRELIHATIYGLDRKGVLVGAGSGTWDDPQVFSELITKTSIDFIDLHIYPGQPQYIDVAIQTADLARLFKKRIIIGETGLYKAAYSEMGGDEGINPAIFARDTFNFFSPLDNAHIGLMTKLSKLRGIELLSPFYVNYFFGYLSYNAEIAVMTPMELMCNSAEPVQSGIINNTLTEYGQNYKDLITEVE